MNSPRKTNNPGVAAAGTSSVVPSGSLANNFLYDQDGEPVAVLDPTTGSFQPYQPSPEEAIVRGLKESERQRAKALGASFDGVYQRRDQVAQIYRDLYPDNPFGYVMAWWRRVQGDRATVLPGLQRLAEQSQTQAELGAQKIHDFITEVLSRPEAMQSASNQVAVDGILRANERDQKYRDSLASLKVQDLQMGTQYKWGEAAANLAHEQDKELLMIQNFNRVLDQMTALQLLDPENRGDLVMNVLDRYAKKIEDYTQDMSGKDKESVKALMRDSMSDLTTELNGIIKGALRERPAEPVRSSLRRRPISYPEISDEDFL